MDQRICFALIIMIAIPLWINTGHPEELSGSVHDQSSTQNDTAGVGLHSLVSRSQEISNDFSLVIGVSMSPLLGMGALGAYGYFTAPDVERAGLPWYNSPKFWIPLLVILLLIMSKDLLTAAIPFLHPLKKPLDAAENFENIISALIAMPIVLPLLVNISDEFLALIFPSIQSQTINAGIMSYLEPTLLAVVGAIGFVLVWLASHSINVLILLSPFGVVDLLLRLFRLSIIGVLLASTAIHPLLGLVFCLILIFIGYRISGWSFRLMIFGTLFSADLLCRRYKRLELDPNQLRAFSSKAIREVPSRTYGYLRRSGESSIEFVYRPWLIWPARSIPLSDMPANCEIGKGLINPAVLEIEGEGKSYTILFRLPPRYKAHEKELARILDIKAIREVGAARGIRAIRQWIAENVYPASTRQWEAS